MSTNVLDPSALLNNLPKYIPDSSKKLASSQEAIAALVHTILSTLAFRLIAVDDASPPATYPDNVLPVEWNAHAPGLLTLRYRHDQSSLEFLIKVTKLGSRTVINAIATETDKAITLDIATADFISLSFFPYDFNETGDRPLVHGFISSNRVSDLVSQLKLKIISKLIPGLRKEGYSEDDGTATAASTSSQPRQPRWDEPPPILPEGMPRRPNDPSRIRPDNPLEIGRRDLDPLPLQIQPNPFRPPSLFPGTSGDGMFVGPDHPIFGGGLGGGVRGPSRGIGGGLPGPWGGDGYLPPMGAPPGARFDPVFPGPQFPGGLRGGRGGQPRFRSGDPDNDDFMPPHGSDDMFS